MNELFVVLYQDRSATDEGTFFWGAKNRQYLLDEFSKDGFDVMCLVGENDPLPKNKDLLFISDQAVICDRETLKKRLEQFLSSEPGFAVKNLVHFVPRHDYDCIRIEAGHPVFLLELPQWDESIVMDIACPEGYHKAQASYRKRIVEKHFNNNVRFLDPDHTYIGYHVKIGSNTLLYPGCIVEGETLIGENSVIGPDCMIKDSDIGKYNTVSKSVIHDSKTGEHCNIGPFAYIRPGCMLHDHVKVGDFVELKNSEIGEKTKIPHLTYIGDASVGGNTNIACGVITANYDGKKKYRTVIGNDAFIGCNVALVAPVTVHDGAYIAAGSTITKEVPPNALAIAREVQVNKEDWVIKKGLQRNQKDDSKSS